MATKKMKIDFGDTPKEIKKGSGKSRHIPEGEYLVKILDADIRTSEKKGSKYINWKFQVREGKYKGAVVYGSTSLKPEALWSLRNLIHAATGKNVAGKAVSFDPANLFGKIVGASVEDNEYTKDGRTKITSQVSTCFPKDEIDSGDDDDEDEDEEEADEETEDDDEEDEELEDVEVEDI